MNTFAAKHAECSFFSHCWCQTHPLTKMSLKCSQILTDDEGSFRVSIYMFTIYIFSQKNVIFPFKHLVDVKCGQLKCLCEVCNCAGYHTVK
jgi:hypothetical protein